jgi:hypothetical protein
MEWNAKKCHLLFTSKIILRSEKKHAMTLLPAKKLTNHH